MEPISGLKCPVMDTGCATTAEGCVAYYENIETGKMCNSLSETDCSTCAGTTGCAWADGVCIGSSNAWVGNVIRTADQCPVTMVIEPIVIVNPVIDDSKCEALEADGCGACTGASDCYWNKATGACRSSRINYWSADFITKTEECPVPIIEPIVIVNPVIDDSKCEALEA